jgi:hypothetical protein
MALGTTTAAAAAGGSNSNNVNSSSNSNNNNANDPATAKTKSNGIPTQGGARDGANFTQKELERIERVLNQELQNAYFGRSFFVDYLTSAEGQKFNGKKCTVVGWDQGIGAR